MHTKTIQKVQKAHIKPYEEDVKIYKDIDNSQGQGAFFCKHRYVLASWSFFHDLLPDVRFPMNFWFSGALKASISDTFWNKIRRFLGRFWHLGSCMPKEVSRYPHNCCRTVYLSLSGPDMDPSWLQVGSSWTHAGPKLAPTWLKLGPCWAQIRVPSRP